MTKVALAAMVLMLTLGASCLTTGNVVIQYIIKDDMVGQTDTNFGKALVDLSTNSDWNDHKEKLNSVDDIGFACKEVLAPFKRLSSFIDGFYVREYGYPLFGGFHGNHLETNL